MNKVEIGEIEITPEYLAGLKPTPKDPRDITRLFSVSPLTVKTPDDEQAFNKEWGLLQTMRATQAPTGLDLNSTLKGALEAINDALNNLPKDSECAAFLRKRKDPLEAWVAQIRPKGEA